MKKILFLLLFLSTNLFAQTSSEEDQFNKQIEEIMKTRAEMLKSLMDDSDSGSLEKHMMEMMKSFDQTGSFGLDQMEGPVVGEYDWVVSDTHKTLKMKVKQIKDHPLDIKIEKGMIYFKGDIEATEGKTKSKVHFEKSFSLPDDVDQNNPEFENKNGELLVKFKKLKASKALKKIPAQTPVKKEKTPNDRVPVTPNQDDLSI